ncbi:MAG: GTPase HflX [Deltaproteobacteria bacterium]|nr:GTPase HflX [Deltaproteobacteria bacterium]
MKHSFEFESHRDNEERVILVGVQLGSDPQTDAQSSLAELERLVETLGGKIIDTFIQRRKSPHPGLYIGRGKAAEIAAKVTESECTLVAFDAELTGSQQKNLEEALDCRVVDRTGVILDIFSRHARTKEAKNQVEVASLEYLASRLTRRWTHLGRQKGGIGLRGLGEKQIELDRRQIRARISRLKQELEHSAEERAIQRLGRDRFLRVAIVGYTNAGKSTLMNHLTQSEVYVDDRLFATLDSTVRIMDPKTRPPILLSDTVGFINKLPHTLVASFRSTLQEVLEADLLMHVVDLAAENYMEQIRVTKSVLDDIGAGHKPSILVFNKADLVKEFFLPKLLERRYVDSQVVSAYRSEDMKRLRESLYTYFERDMMEMEVNVPYTDTWLQAQIFELSKVLELEYLPSGTRMKIRIMRSDAHTLKLQKSE